MTQFDIHNVVESILEAFANGMNIFSRMKRKKTKKGTELSRTSEEELKLQNSLSNRPKEIKAEYSHSVVKHGKQFEKGDSEAYSSLAHTLLMLNTGLINVINDALASTMVDASTSRRSLLSLSESAAFNTMQALGQLSARISVPKDLVRSSDHRRQKRKPAKQTFPQDEVNRPPHSPLLERGGWVRSKSSSSVVCVTPVKRQAARKMDHIKSKSSPLVLNSTPCEQPMRSSAIAQSSFLPDESSSHQKPSSVRTEEKISVVTAQCALDTENGRPQSMLLIPADYFDSLAELKVFSPSPSPPIPPKIPLHVRGNARIQKRPPSTATFLTASTKIGEIAEYNRADRALISEEQEKRPLPYVIPPPMQPMRPKGRGLKFWKNSKDVKAI